MKQQQTVHQLRLSGKHVKISHLRRYYRFDSKTGKKKTVLLSFEDHKEKYPDFFLDAFGGHTTMSIIDKADADKFVSVVAKCTDFDRYDRKLGVKIALGKALNAFNKRFQ